MLPWLYELGMGVSYEITLEVEDWRTAVVCQRFELDQYVCLSQMREGIFTAYNINNSSKLISWNPHKPSSVSDN